MSPRGDEKRRRLLIVIKTRQKREQQTRQESVQHGEGGERHRGVARYFVREVVRQEAQATGNRNRVVLFRRAPAPLSFLQLPAVGDFVDGGAEEGLDDGFDGKEEDPSSKFVDAHDPFDRRRIERQDRRNGAGRPEKTGAVEAVVRRVGDRAVGERLRRKEEGYQEGDEEGTSASVATDGERGLDICRDGARIIKMQGVAVSGIIFSCCFHRAFFGDDIDSCSNRCSFC
mmetsp:Transcript_17374/g.39217  ORF Transcript_17374/g.39217 Transcript_17374/m.39217 type:complete len:229 (-) Transcript_17374:125-811(-)